MRIPATVFRGLLVLALALPAAGQAFNIDFGKSSFDAPMPSNGYGAAAGQPGFWNSDFAGAASLFDLAGNATTATYSRSIASVSTPVGGPTTDESLMMEDAARGAATAFDPVGLQIGNLQPGLYRIFVYGWAGSVYGNASNKIELEISGSQSTDLLTINYAGQWPGQQVLGQTYATWDFTITSPHTFLGIFPQNRGTIDQPRYSFVNGVQIVPLPSPYGAAAFGVIGLLSLGRRRLAS